MPSLYGGYGTSQPSRLGWRVMRVKNTRDSGPGSLREAVETNAPRIILFDVPGLIQLQSPLEIVYSNMFIDGKSAPYPGIHIVQEQSTPFGDTYPRGLLQTNHNNPRVDNVEICYLFLHKGDPPEEANMSCFIFLTAHNWHLHHLTVGFTHDNNGSFFRLVEDPDQLMTNITVDHCWFHHPFSDHATGFNFTNGPTNEYIGMYDADIRCNVFCHAGHRAPQVMGGTTVSGERRGVIVANNLTYGWQSRIGGIRHASNVDWIGNYAKPSAESGFTTLWRVYDTTYGNPSIYVDGNVVEWRDGTEFGQDYDHVLLPGEADIPANYRDVFGYSPLGNPVTYSAVPNTLKRSTKLPQPAKTIKYLTAEQAYTHALNSAGAHSHFPWLYGDAMKADIINGTSLTGHLTDFMSDIATLQDWSDTWYPVGPYAARAKSSTGSFGF